MNVINLNGRWHYRPITKGDTLEYGSPHKDTSSWQTLKVPQNWALADLHHDGVMWYRRNFDMPQNEGCYVWWLEFTGVDYQCDVWVNGQYVGSHVGYFARFRFDVTDALVTGSNLVAIRLVSPDDTAAPTNTRQHIRGVLGSYDVPGSTAQRRGNTGGIWGDVMLMPYDCEDPPEQNDWYTPLVAPVINVDEQTGIWRRGDAPFFPRGSNYLPAQYISEMTREGFERDVSLMKEANLNIVRVYAHILPDAFYEVCNELGMLVWQDFPLYLGYEDTDEFRKDALLQVEQMVRQLGGHPCIAVWGIHTDAPWDGGDSDQNRELDDMLAARVRELDSDRYIHLNSRGDALDAYGDSKWQEHLDDLPYSMVMAFGAQAMPILETLRTILPDSGLLKYMSLPSDTNPELSDEDTLIEFVDSSQDHQTHVIKYATEAYRLKKGDGVTGIFHHMFVDGLPAISTSVLDYWRRPKKGFAALKQAMQPVLPIAALPIAYTEVIPSGEAIPFHIYIVNDLPERFEGWICKVSMTAWEPRTDETSTFMHHWNEFFRDFVIDPCGKIDLGEVVMPPLPANPKEYHLVLQLFDLHEREREAIVNTYILRVGD
jgi:hypothetical protein